MPSRHLTKSILRDRKLAPKKKLGQNFLVNKMIIEEIINKAAPKPDDTIIEVGVGLGALTMPLAKRVKKIIGIEVDSGIVALHHEKKTLPENVELLHEDILECDLAKLAAKAAAPLKIIANLPYSISNPLLFRLIENRQHLTSAVVMLQKEVGMRLVASPGTKEYGVLSVLLGACASIEKLLTIGPGNFHPRPKVDSVVVRITFSPTPTEVKNRPVCDHALLKQIVKKAFQQRRKTLLNALGAAPFSNLDKEQTKELIITCGLSPTVRPDKLTITDYINLTNKFNNS